MKREPYPQTNKTRWMIQHLRRGSNLRRIAEQVFRNGPQPVEDITPLLAAFSSYHWEKAEEAAWLVETLPLSQEQKQACCITLIQCAHWALEARAGKSVEGGLRFFIVIGILSIVLLYGDLLFAAKNGEWGVGFLGVFVLGCILFVLPAFALTDFFQRRTFRAYLRALGHLRDPESISVLAATAVSASVDQEGLAALRLCLPGINTDHSGKFPPQTVTDLCLLLNKRDDKVVFEILRALETIGNGHAVRPIKRLAKRGRTPAIREEAARILPILRERQQQENAPTTLLRASKIGDQGLLRVSEPETEANAVQLLRPNIGEESQDQPEILLRPSQRDER